MESKLVYLNEIKIPDILQKISEKPTEDFVRSVQRSGIQEPIETVEIFPRYGYYICDGVKRVNALKACRKQNNMQKQIEIITHEVRGTEQYNKFIVEKILRERNIKELPVSALAELVLIYYSTVTHQGKRNDLNDSEKSGIKLCSEKFGISQRQISRYIRVQNCTKRVLDCLDNKKISLRAAVELSYIECGQQDKILDLYESNNKKMTYIKMKYVSTGVKNGQAISMLAVRSCHVEDKVLEKEMKERWLKKSNQGKGENAELMALKEKYREEKHLADRAWYMSLKGGK